MPIKKRRPTKYISKNEEGLRRREAQALNHQKQGTLQSRFPMISQLRIQMDFFNREQHLLGSETRHFEANDIVAFTIDCLGRCGNGRLDVSGVVAQMANNRQSSRESKGFCPELLYPGSNDTCGCELRCKLEADFI